MLIHNVKSTIPCLFILIQLISLPPQTCKRSFKLISSDTTFAHLFVLIICEPISHIYTYATQTSYFIPNTQRKVTHTRSRTFGRRRLGAAVWAPAFGRRRLGAPPFGRRTFGRRPLCERK